MLQDDDAPLSTARNLEYLALFTDAVAEGITLVVHDVVGRSLFPLLELHCEESESVVKAELLKASPLLPDLLEPSSVECVVAANPRPVPVQLLRQLLSFLTNYF